MFKLWLATDRLTEDARLFEHNVMDFYAVKGNARRLVRGRVESQVSNESGPAPRSSRLRRFRLFSSRITRAPKEQAQPTAVQEHARSQSQSEHGDELLHASTNLRSSLRSRVEFLRDTEQLVSQGLLARSELGMTAASLRLQRRVSLVAVVAALVGAASFVVAITDDDPPVRSSRTVIQSPPPPQGERSSGARTDERRRSDRPGATRSDRGAQGRP
jgi:hypothetical protein